MGNIVTNKQVGLQYVGSWPLGDIIAKKGYLNCFFKFSLIAGLYPARLGIEPRTQGFSVLVF
jgi:hypothetical protein